MKIQTQTTLLFTTLTGAFFIIFGLTVYYFVGKADNNDFHKRLELRARISAKFRFEQDQVSTESFRQIQREYLEKLSDEKAFIFSLDQNGSVAPALPAEISKSYIKEIAKANGNTVFDQRKFRHYAGLLYHDETGDFIVIKSATNQYGIQLLTKLRDTMIITFLGYALIIFLVGYFFAKRTFRPFRTINAKVKQINENNLHLRLEDRSGSDEISELTTTFNKMIDRIELAFETQNNFVSNASHELRTPLTTIIGEADLALAKERGVEEYKQSLQSIARQSAKLKHLIKGLLSLAQTGFDGKKITWEKFRVDELIFEVKQGIDDIMPENDIKVAITSMPEDEEKVSIFGSRDFIKIAISNIVLNACKYSNNKTVLITLQFETGKSIIKVTDDGIGIPASELKHIFDPFFRASNTNRYEGYGIGMPLAQNIVRLHKGKISVQSAEDQGTTVTVMLPVCQS
ncbi:MAG: HAMP domain-containing sensor histidine kinase [Bacteroidota bacterium]|nr:HAMP domain-containing sensor histidine kinase [Ferruginibacter sp.]